MKNIFEVNEKEKARIRKLHENYTILDECGEDYSDDVDVDGRLDQDEDEIAFLVTVGEDDVIEMEEGDESDEELPENNRTLGGGDETKGGLPKQKGSKPSVMKK
jgi:hypothetical protein